MTAIVLNRFFGVVPMKNPRLLETHQAQKAINCDLRAGALRPWKTSGFEFRTVKPGPIESIYRYSDADGNPVWFHWPTDVDVVSSPVINTAAKRVYFTGDGWPKLTFESLATTQGGGTLNAFPYAAYLLGLPSPDAPTYAGVVGKTGTIVGAAASGYHATTSTGQSTILTVSGSSPITASMDASLSIVPSDFKPYVIEFQIIRDGVVLDSRTESVPAVSDSQFAQAETRSANFTYTDTPPAGDRTYEFKIVITQIGVGVVDPPSAFKSIEGTLTGDSTEVTLDTADNGLAAGDQIQIENVVGMTKLNGTWKIIAVDGATITVPLATTQTYTSGGTWTQVAGADSQSTDEAADTRAYVVTFISDLDDGSGKVQEGPPSLPTPLKSVAPGSTVNLNIPLPPVDPSAGSYHITGRRIYRTITDDTGTAVYHFVGEVLDTVTGTFADDVTDTIAAANEILPSEGWVAPPHDLQGLIELPGGVLAGFHGNEVCMCVPYQPHAWPLKYRQTTHAPIVGIGAFGSSVLVTTTGRPEIITGPEPGATSSDWAELTEPCFAKRGVVDMGYAIVYPAPAGLMLVSAGQTGIITADLFTEEQWRALKPETFIAARWGDLYVCFYDDADDTTPSGFIFDPKNRADRLTFLDLAATEAWNDPATGDLYIVVDGDVRKWNTGTSSQAVSGDTAFPVIFTVDIGKATGVVTFEWATGGVPDKAELWLGGVKVLDTGYIGDAAYQDDLDNALNAKGLPSEPVVQSAYPDIFNVGDTVVQLESGNADGFTFDKDVVESQLTIKIYSPISPSNWTFRVDAPGGLTMDSAWRSKRFVSTRQINFAAAQVHAASYPVTFRLYSVANDVPTLKKEVTVEDAKPFWLPDGYLADQWEVELAGAAKIDAVYLAESMDELSRVA